MQVVSVPQEPEFDPTEERERRIHLLEKRRAEILKEVPKIERQLVQLKAQR